MPTIKEQLADNIVRHWRFRDGHTYDLSSNDAGQLIVAGNTPQWVSTRVGYGVKFDKINSRFDAGTDPIGTGAMTCVVIANPRSSGENNTGRIFDNGKCVFYVTPTNRLGFSSNFSTFINSGTNGVYFDDTFYNLAVTRTAAGVANFYVNGSLSGTANQSSGTPAAATTNLFLGASSAGASTFHGSFIELIIFDTVLTATQIGTLYQEMYNELFLLNTAKRNFKGSELLTYENFEQNLFWTAGTGWTYSNNKFVASGSTASSLYQDVCEAGKTYTIQFKVNNYVSGSIQAICGTTLSEAVANDGVYTFTLTCDSGTVGGLYKSDACDFEIEYIKISEGTTAEFIEKFEDIPITIGSAISSGAIGSFDVNQNEFKLIRDSDGVKWLTGTNASLGYATTSLDWVYGTIQFDLYKATTGSQIIVYLNLDNKNNDITQNCYFLYISSNEDIQFGVLQGGSTTFPRQTDPSYIAIATNYTIRVTRTVSGDITLYIKGGAYTDWTLVTYQAGANPFNSAFYETGATHFGAFLTNNDRITNIKYYKSVLDIDNFPNL